MNLTCIVCGSKDWVSCDPGTSADATRFACDLVVEIQPAVEQPMRAWCLAHWRESLVRVPVRSDDVQGDDLFDFLRVEDAKVALAVRSGDAVGETAA